MNYDMFANLMKKISFTSDVKYKTAFGGMLSRFNKWPKIVSGISAKASIVKLPKTMKNEYGNDVRVIGFENNVFAGNERISNVIIPDLNGVLHEGAFAGCKNLERIYLPIHKIIEEGAFRDCDNLKDVYFEGSFEQWKEIDITHEKHEVIFGDLIPGTPVQDVAEEYIRNIPGNEALFKATIHFNCKYEDLCQDDRKLS